MNATSMWSKGWTSDGVWPLKTGSRKARSHTTHWAFFKRAKVDNSLLKRIISLVLNSSKSVNPRQYFYIYRKFHSASKDTDTQVFFIISIFKTVEIYLIETEDGGLGVFFFVFFWQIVPCVNWSPWSSFFNKKITSFWLFGPYFGQISFTYNSSQAEPFLRLEGKHYLLQPLSTQI